MQRQAERLTPPVSYHGEGPFWDQKTRRLLVMDVLAGVIVAVHSSQEISRHPVPNRAATVVRRRASGGFVIATERGVVGCDDDFGAFSDIATLPVGSDVRTNDGGCDPSGGFVVGTMAYDEREGAGTVYQVRPDHQVVKLLSPVTISNGVQWSADGARAFFVDTPTRRIDVFDVDPVTGAWSSRRTHLSLHGVSGYPDGMAIDDEDGLWVAMWGGGAVNHYDASGRLVEQITVPGVSQVSSCAFGGDARDVLHITTSRQGLPDHREPSAGAVFAVTTQSRGQSMRAFAG